MKAKFTLLAIGMCLVNLCYAQRDTISEAIKLDRDKLLINLNDQLTNNQAQINELQQQINRIGDNQTDRKIQAMERLQIAFDNRIKIIEETPKVRTSMNGQLAFTELLCIQRDIQPAGLFLTSQSFIKQLGNLGNLQEYEGFKSWKTKYDNWYKKENSNDQMFALVNSSIELISNAANNVPLYGSIIQTASSGITTLVSNLGKKNKELKDTTPEMLGLLNVISQFEAQKSIIDHEWDAINSDLNVLQDENSNLLREQLEYYGLSETDYQTDYMQQTIDRNRDKYKDFCRKEISNKINQFAKIDESWKFKVETYMYKVQSMRMRFGMLTSRMLANIDNYTNLIRTYSADRFPPAFTTKLTGLNSSLVSIKAKFANNFQPSKYIEDSAVMYLIETTAASN